MSRCINRSGVIINVGMEEDAFIDLIIFFLDSFRAVKPTTGCRFGDEAASSGCASLRAPIPFVDNHNKLIISSLMQ